MKNIEKIGYKISLTYGLTFGVFFFIVSLIVLFFLSSEISVLLLISLLHTTEFSIAIGFSQTAFISSLYFLGKRNSRRIMARKPILLISTEFSFIVNGLIWIAFLIPILINGDLGSIYLVSIVCFTLFIGLGILTTFTIGYYIVRLTAEKINVCK